MPTDPSFSTRVFGQAGKTLNAVLDRQLAGTGLDEPQWVILTLAVNSGPALDRDRFTGQIAEALKISQADAQARINDMIAAKHLQDGGGDGATVTVTDAARQLHGRINGTVSEITQRLWCDLPAEDLDTTGRVLSIITERANAELAR